MKRLRLGFEGTIVVLLDMVRDHLAILGALREHRQFSADGFSVAFLVPGLVNFPPAYSIKMVI